MPRVDLILSDSPRDKTCRDCRNLRWPLTEKSYGDIKSLAARCHTYLLIRNTVTHYSPNLADEVVVSIDVTDEGVVWTEPLLDGKLRVWWPSEEQEPGFDATVYTSSNLVRDIIGDTSSEEVFSVASRWIELCNESHAGCSIRTSPLPNRVLDISKYSNLTDEVSLYESSNEPGKYACLSYCWGETLSLQTTTATIAQHKQCISWSQLPRTFQDSIIFLRRIGVPHVWIDSICIIQDDPADWRREASKMHLIYRKAYLTISASKNKTPNESLYSKPAGSYILSPLFGYDRESGFVTRQCLPHGGSLGEFPLFGRAWAFQERILSNRVLHFGSQEIFWECLDGHVCECGEAKPEDMRLPFRDVLDIDATPQKVTNRWHQMVTKYSKLKLTYGKDIFPAFSGIVQKLVSRSQKDYLAGLWRHTLVEDLLWRNSFDSGGRSYVGGYQHAILPMQRPTPWRAPTWSWASILTPVEYPISGSYQFALHPLIHEASCIPVEVSDPTGEISSGRITLTGPITSVILRFNNMGSEQLADVHRPDDGSLLIRFHVDYDLGSPSEYRMRNGEDVYCLRVGVFVNVESREVYRWSYLILRCIDAPEQIFERIGFASHEGVNEKEYLRENKQTRKITLV